MMDRVQGEEGETIGTTSTREAAVIRNPQQEFAAKLAEKRVHTQMADSIASMVLV